MHLKCRVQKIKVEWSNQNKRLANTFDRNFDQTRNESLVLRAVRHVFKELSIILSATRNIDVMWNSRFIYSVIKALQGYHYNTGQ